jgi:hypothetical protein
MPEFPPGHIYRGGPLDALYHRYHLRCRVEREEDKAYYWPQMERIYARLLPEIEGWQDCRLRSDQALERRLGKDGLRTTLRNAPTGGLQKLTRDNLHRVATQYLSNNTHLVAKFNGDLEGFERCFDGKGKECVYFFLTEIRAHRRRLKYDPSLMFFSLPHDLMIRIGGYDYQHAMTVADPINQSLDIFIWDGAMPVAKREALVRELAAMTGAIHLWYALSGFMGEQYTDADGFHHARYWVEDRYEDAVGGRNRYGSLWVDMLALDKGQNV